MANKRFDVCFIIIAIIVVALSILADNWILIQPTRSYARGIYIQSNVIHKFKRGDIVSISFKDKELCERPDTYPLPNHLPWHTFIKVIYGVPGDLIYVSDQRFIINGKNIGPVFEKDSKGRPLARVINGEYRLQDGWFFVSTPNPRSFGSHYFGPVHISQLKLAAPLLVLPSDKPYFKMKGTKMKKESEKALVATLEISGLLKFFYEKGITDLYVNPDGSVWTDRVGIGKRKENMNILPEQTEAICRCSASCVGTIITAKDCPYVEAELECFDFARLEGLTYPLVSAPCFAIRLKAVLNKTLEELSTEKGMLTLLQVDLIKKQIASSRNFLVSGSTGSGKTTLINSMLKEIGDKRIITLEETRELDVSHIEDSVAMCTYGDVDIDKLLRISLRLRPDVIIIGELRGAEGYSLMKANRTGHSGSISSIHGEDPQAAMVQFEDYVNESHLNNVSKNRIADTIDIVIQVNKITSTGERKVTEIAKVLGYNGQEYALEQIG